MKEVEVRQTQEFSDWLDGLRDPKARSRVLIRLRRLSLGNAGDSRSVGAGLFELRIPYGPGYRVYFVRRGESMVVLLTGGDKSTQDSDIENARRTAQHL